MRATVYITPNSRGFEKNSEELAAKRVWPESVGGVVACKSCPDIDSFPTSLPACASSAHTGPDKHGGGPLWHIVLSKRACVGFHVGGGIRGW